jgi:hypothetical protein
MSPEARGAVSPVPHEVTGGERVFEEMQREGLREQHPREELGPPGPRGFTAGGRSKPDGDDVEVGVRRRGVRLHGRRERDPQVIGESSGPARAGRLKVAVVHQCVREVIRINRL